MEVYIVYSFSDIIMTSRMSKKPASPTWKLYVKPFTRKLAIIMSKESVKLRSGRVNDIGNAIFPITAALVASFFVHSGLKIKGHIINNELTKYNEEHKDEERIE